MACTDLDKAAPATGDDRHLHEECGVFGVCSNVTTDVASLAYYALYALQHRGQESAGIVVNDDGLFRSWRDVGLVSDVFLKERLRSLGLGNIVCATVPPVRTTSATSSPFWSTTIRAAWRWPTTAT